MSKVLVVVDMQNDFITGTLGSKQAQSIVPVLAAKIESYKRQGFPVIFTRDTHFDNYLSTQEGQKLPVLHCVKGTEGHCITNKLNTDGCKIVDKPTFGCLQLADVVTGLCPNPAEIELCGLCTDICVVSNALILKAQLPQVKISVDVNACAGATDEGHKAAILTMKMCQVEITD